MAGNQKHRIVRFLAGTGLIAGGVLIGLIGGVAYGGNLASLPPARILNARNAEGETPDLSLFWQAWNIVDAKFNGSLDSDKKVEGAVAGLVAGLNDPYSVYLKPQDDEKFRADLHGSFGGIGTELVMRNGLVTVVAALDDTPAQRAGIKAQDIIVSVDGESLEGVSLDGVVDRIRGEKGTDVTLEIAREGESELLSFKIVRDTIVVKSVTMEDAADGSVAHIRVSTFGDETYEAFKAALETVKQDGRYKGVVLDLRDNPGGYLDVAVKMTGLLIPEKPAGENANLLRRTVTIERYADGKETVHTASTKPVLTDLPLTVLVNGGSASASEIMAGALAEYGRGTLVGTTTFGKGSVQELHQLKNGGSIKITVAKWLTPLGVAIDEKGVTPTLEAEDSADSETTEDVQLQAAVNNIINR